MNRIEAPEFWQWAFSDFMSNALRGILAEFIVAKAIRCAQKLRTEWDAYDLVTDEGLKIEVKSSAYLQAWEQKRHSVIRFDIGHKKSWNAQTNTSSSQAIRSANVYVFCVFSATDTDKAIADPLNLAQWFFLVCSTQWLNEKLGNQKSVGLVALEQFGLKRLPFDQLAREICAAKS
jgi:hypothetical protein